MGRGNTRVKWLLRRYANCARGIGEGINRDPTDLNNLRANAIYSHRGTDKLLSLIDETRREGGWLIFYTHDVSDSPSEFGCTIGDFQTIAEAVNAAGIDVLTVDDVIRSLAPNES